MSPMKVMPLLLTCITPFVMVSGTARAAEPQIILAQAQTPQQLEEERKRKLQQQQQQHGRASHNSSRSPTLNSRNNRSRTVPRARSLRSSITRRSSNSIFSSRSRLRSNSKKLLSSSACSNSRSPTLNPQQPPHNAQGAPASPAA